MTLKKIYSILVGILLGYSTFMLLLPIPKDQLFWFPLSLTILSIISQFLFVYLTAVAKGKPKNTIYGISVIRLGFYYFVAQFIISNFSILLRLPIWIPLGYSAFLIAITAIGTIGAYSSSYFMKNSPHLVYMTKQMTAIDKKVRELIETCDERTLTSKLSKLLEEISDSDPISSEHTLPIERDIESLLILIEESFSDPNARSPFPLVEKCFSLLEKRNKLITDKK